MTAPQKEYIITEEELRGMEICQQRICHTIRSRPSPSPQKPTLDQIWLDLAEHDTTIRNAALDEVKSGILDAMNERSFTDSDGDYFQCSQLSKDEIDMVIKSLRTKEQP